MKARTGDGSEIFYQVYDFTDPWKSSEPVLLHHGLRGNHRQWFPWVPLLSRFYRVIVLDARGRGESTVPPPSFPWSMEQFATDVLAVLDHAGIERVHYVGGSFGGVVGLYLGSTYPQRLETLSLLSTPYRFTQLSEVTTRWVREMRSMGALEFLRRDVRNMFPEDTDPALLEWQAQQMASVPDHVALELLQFSAGVNLGDLLPKISVPTLMVAAGKSDRAPSGESAFMRKQIPNCRFVSLDSAHNIQMTMPEKCIEIVTGFLKEHPIAAV